jgi:hypothetical protein
MHMEGMKVIAGIKVIENALKEARYMARLVGNLEGALTAYENAANTSAEPVVHINCVRGDLFEISFTIIKPSLETALVQARESLERAEGMIAAAEDAIMGYVG